MPTNEYGQPVTESGHVLTATELIANELKAILLGLDLNDAQIAAIVKAVPGYIVQRENDSYYRGQASGRLAGLREGLAIAKAVIGEDEPLRLEATPSTKTVGMALNELRAKQRTELAKAFEALQKGEKGIQVTKDEYIKLAGEVSEAISKGANGDSK